MSAMGSWQRSRESGFETPSLRSLRRRADPLYIGLYPDVSPHIDRLDTLSPSATPSVSTQPLGLHLDLIDFPTKLLMPDYTYTGECPVLERLRLYIEHRGDINNDDSEPLDDVEYVENLDLLFACMRTSRIKALEVDMRLDVQREHGQEAGVPGDLGQGRAGVQEGEFRRGRVTYV